MDQAWPLLIFLPLAFFMVLVHFYRSNLLLQQWAEQNGYHITEQQYRWFFKGPFFWTTSRGQTVYSVVVEDDAGRTRRGWVRCGGWWFGLLSSNTEVRWEDY